MKKSVVVITPTIGGDYLKQCIDSVAKQTYSNIKHMIVVDGSEYFDKIIFDFGLTPMALGEYLVVLPKNVGADGWYGHRIYAAMTYLVNEDYIVYLDEDNWLEPNHVEKLVETIENKSLDWSYSFRNIVDKEGNYICRDNCESLGKWTGIGNYNHIDTSCFCVKREVAVKVAHNWYGKWGADRKFFLGLHDLNGKWESSSEYSMNYRLDGNLGSPKRHFFMNGNIAMQERYCNIAKFPWEKDYV